MSAGGFWPSPSSVQTSAPRAASTPEWMAADWPPGAAWRRARSQGAPAAIRASTSGVSSAEPSSTTMTSMRRPARAPAMPSRSGGRLKASLRAGITTESSGGGLPGGLGSASMMRLGWDVMGGRPSRSAPRARARVPSRARLMERAASGRKRAAPPVSPTAGARRRVRGR